MSLSKMSCAACLFAVLAGCASAALQQRSTTTAIAARRARQERAQARHPYAPYFHWAEPQIQLVHEPAHIENGAFHPAQVRPVIIRPGAWRERFNYPIDVDPIDAQATDK